MIEHEGVESQDNSMETALIEVRKESGEGVVQLGMCSCVFENVLACISVRAHPPVCLRMYLFYDPDHNRT